MEEDFDPTVSNEGMLSSLLRNTAGVAGAGLSGVLGSPAALSSLALRGTGFAAKGLNSLINSLQSEQPMQDYNVDNEPVTEPESDNRSIFRKAVDFLDIESPNHIANKISDAVYSVTNTAADNLDKFDSSHLKSYLDHYTGDYTKPKGQVASAIQETASDLGGMFGFGGAGKIAKGVPAVVKGGLEAAKNAIKLFTAANTVKHGAMALGVPEDSANYLKIGTMLMGPAAVGTTKELFGKGTISKLTKNNYEIANKVVDTYPNKVRINGKPEVLNNIKKYTESGLGLVSPEKKKLSEIASRFSDISPNGYMPIKEVWETKKDLDKIIRPFTGNKKFMKEVLPVRKLVSDTLSRYGDKYPEFGNAFKNAEALHKISRSTDFIEKASKNISGANNPTTSKLIASLATFGLGGKKAVAAYKALGPISKQAQAFTFSPAYRKHALDLGKSISMGSIPMAKRAIKGIVKLDSEDDGFVLGPEERVS
jgi:hypothetical protein